MCAVGQGDGVEHHEGIFGVPFDPFDHLVLDEFLGVGFAKAFSFVPGEGDRLVVIVEVGGEVGVGVALAVIAVEAVDSLLVRGAGGVEKSHAPFAEGGGGVAGRFCDFADRDGVGGDGPLAFGNHFAVSADGAFSGVESGEEDGAARGADGGAAVGLHVAGAFFGELVDAGSLDELLTIDADVSLGDVIREDEDEIGLLFFGESERGAGREEEDPF